MSTHNLPLANGVSVITPANVWETHHVTIIPPPGATGTVTLRGATFVGAAFEDIPDSTIDLAAPESVRFVGPLQRLEVTQSDVTGSGDILVVINSDGNIQQGRGYKGFVDGVRPGAYDGTSALVAIPSVEMNIRRGNQFSWTWYIPALASGATVYAGFVVGPTHKVIIKTRTLATDGGVTYQAHGNSTFTFNPDNEIPNINLNGDSAEVSDLKVYSLSLGEISDIGTVLPGGIIRSAEGQGNQVEQGVFSDVGIERILRRDQRNVISITNNEDAKTNYVVLDITWYEGPVIPGPDNPV